MEGVETQGGRRSQAISLGHEPGLQPAAGSGRASTVPQELSKHMPACQEVFMLPCPTTPYLTHPRCTHVPPMQNAAYPMLCHLQTPTPSSWCRAQWPGLWASLTAPCAARWVAFGALGMSRYSGCMGCHTKHQGGSQCPWCLGSGCEWTGPCPLAPLYHMRPFYPFPIQIDAMSVEVVELVGACISPLRSSCQQSCRPLYHDDTWGDRPTPCMSALSIDRLVLLFVCVYAGEEQAVAQSQGHV